ncbi:winged helix-turn-helix domain-containing protein [Paenibacillus caui]|uniref:winged helix-turn-helix domain-containing protein n=1 Tax=Paenibacillus caui TaxID=2873927 RepID=UPI001CAA12E2|nr:helix-turn-helix domain-containing protein [Paenibacillus caui]
MRDILELKTPAEIKIYSDPYRLKIFHGFNKFGRPATVKEVADSLGEVPAKVYYHVKKLESIKLLQVVETREINGIVAKYYEPFQGDIRLKSEIKAELEKVYLSETQKLIQEMYEMSKQKFLSSIDGTRKTSGHLVNNSLYMTKEEAAQLVKDFEALIEPYVSKRRGAHIYTHEIFLSLINETGGIQKSNNDSASSTGNPNSEPPSNET